MRSPFTFEFDPKIERNLRSRRKNLRLEEQRAKAQEASSMMAGGGDDQRRTLQDFLTPGVQGIAYSIAQPNVEAITLSLSQLLSP